MTTSRQQSLRYTRNPAHIIRDAEMVLMFRDGQTLQQIGDKYGITRERVRQCFNRLGLAAVDGGRTMRSLRGIHDMAGKQNAKLAAREQRHFDKWGMSRAELDAISDLPRGHSKHPIIKFQYQRRNSRTRGIAWELKFADWWRIWQESGKWEQRGRGQGYCMARWADDGPYAEKNVYICTIGQNFKDSYITKPAAQRAEKARITRAASRFNHQSSPSSPDLLPSG